MAEFMFWELEVFEDTVKFRKSQSKETGTVNVFVNDREVDVFTDYEIGDSYEKFVASCKEYAEHMKEELTE